MFLSLTLRSLNWLQMHSHTKKSAMTRLKSLLHKRNKKRREAISVNYGGKMCGMFTRNSGGSGTMGETVISRQWPRRGRGLELFSRCSGEAAITFEPLIPPMRALCVCYLRRFHNSERQSLCPKLQVKF